MQQNLKNKYSEWLKSKLFELKKNPDLMKESYLMNHQNILVHTVPLKSQMKEDDFYHFRRVVFMPTHLYNKPSFNITIGDKVIDLLQCMYVVTKQSYEKSTVVQVELQNFNDINQNLPNYQVSCKSDQNHLEIQAGIVGDKYLILSIQSSNSIDIKVFNLDLTLIFEYQKEHQVFITDEYYLKHINTQNYFDNEIDYHEPGIIFLLGFSILIRIDLNNSQVITKIFDEKHKNLLRLMPITQSEFKYYFKSSKTDSIQGYNQSDEEYVVLFVILDYKIYQININNLEIIRLININIQKIKQFAEPIFSVFVVPIPIKDRQRKTFSKWTFLVHGRPNEYYLTDWREQNLFKKQNQKLENSYLINYAFSQRIFMLQDKVYVLINDNRLDNTWNRKDSSASFYLTIDKKKGEKHYHQSINENESTEIVYFSQSFFIRNFFHPILYKDELTYPCYMENVEDDSLFHSNFIGFHSFKEQAEKQAQYQLKELSDCDIEELENLKICFFSIQDNKNIILYQIQQNKITNQHYSVFLQDDQNIQDYFLNQESLEQFFITSQNQAFQLNSYQLSTNGSQVSKVQLFLDKIVCYSNFTFDLKTNKTYLPLIYFKGQDEYFCIFDINQKQIIQKTIHLFKHTKGLLSHYDEGTNLFTLLFFKSINKSSYLFFYQLNMKTYNFKLVNLHIFENNFEINNFSQHLKVENNSFNVLISNQNLSIKFNEQKKLEVKEVIKNCLARYDTQSEYEKDTKRKYFFLQNSSQKILYLGFYPGVQYQIQNILSIYDIRQKDIQFVSKDIIQQDQLLLEDEERLIHVNQLQTGQILICYGNDKFKILKYN